MASATTIEAGTSEYIACHTQGPQSRGRFAPWAWDTKVCTPLAAPKERLNSVHSQMPPKPTAASCVAPSRPTIAESTACIRVVESCVITTGYARSNTSRKLPRTSSSSAFAEGPQTMLYDNTKLAVARILGDGKRKRTRAFGELISHYLFADRFGRPGKGNDKGKVEGLVGYARRNFLVPIPRFESFEALNAHLEQCCRERLGARLRGHTETIAERLERDRAALLPLPGAPYDAC